MSQLRFLSAGESHGKGIMAILEGLPSGLVLDIPLINAELKRRQEGYGRGGRMSIESDEIQLLAGVQGNVLTGAPIGLFIANRDHKNFADTVGMDAKNPQKSELTKVRPGHADLSGCIKYNTKNARDILERASARETAAKVAAGAICKQFLQALGITIASHVINIGGIKSGFSPKTAAEVKEKNLDSSFNCGDENAVLQMKKRIDFAEANGDTLGGEITVLADNMPVGVGSHIQFDKRLDFMLSGLLGAIPAVKSVSFGEATENASLEGSRVHDEIYVSDGKIFRTTNRSGGIEGGMSNGETIQIKIAVKPIPTLMKGLQTVDIKTGEKCSAASERSDVCAVAATSVVAESVLAFGLTQAILDCIGGDFIEETIQRIEQKRANERGAFPWQN